MLGVIKVNKVRNVCKVHKVCCGAGMPINYCKSEKHIIPYLYKTTGSFRSLKSKKTKTDIMKNLKILFAAALLLAGLSSSSFAQEQGVMVGGALMVPSLNIVENAMNAGNVTTLVTAVKAAGLAETLMGKGPFTVFAPTNSAFDKLPEGTVSMLLEKENKDKLAGILTYHVVPGSYTSKDLYDGQTLATVQGETIMINIKDGKVWINGSAMVETADVISSNGVTHVIDTVIMPPSK
jgi:uncharacterized surface protein with fasciclin (FAS1) repeats